MIPCLNRCKGGEWKPRDFLPEESVRDLGRLIKRLRATLDNTPLDRANRMRLQRIDDAVRDMEREYYEDDILFLQALVGALLDAKAIIESIYRGSRFIKPKD